MRFKKKKFFDWGPQTRLTPTSLPVTVTCRCLWPTLRLAFAWATSRLRWFAANIGTFNHDGYQILFGDGRHGVGIKQNGPARAKISSGDTVVIKEGVKHWHGATKDSWFAHLAITAGPSEWCEEVSDEIYNELD